MKKTLIAFLCTFIALPAMADNYIKFKASAIEDTINTMVPESHRASAADEYQKQMNSTTGKISVMGIYKVCAAAGFNINNTNGYNGCRLFINTIAEKSGFGFGSANQQKCKTKFNGIWALSPDGKQYQCVGKDGYELVYHASCNGAGGDCIRDFSSLQTQEPNAREFIQTYGQQKNLQFTCWYTFDESRWQINNPKPQDYIKCSAGGKAYEFEFDDLIQDPGKTAVESENTALCEMFGGKIVKHPDSSIEKQWQSCEVSREICNGLLHNLAVKIGHNVMYQGYCRLSRTVKETSVVGLKTLPGVDSRIFYNTGAQMRAGMAKQQTEEYLRTKFPNETYVNCNPNPKILNAGLGIDTDYVMTCTVGSKQVDFIFHDLTEGNDGRAATGMDAMQCIISGGTFKGESCRGPTQAECDALDAALRAKGSSEGAKWDDNVRACIMGNAMKTYKRDVTTGYIVGAVVIVGGTIAVIGTGGAAAPAIIGGAEMLVTDLAINWAIDANHRRLSKGAATRFGDFIEDADKCTDEQCALQVLKKHYKSLSGVIDDLNTEDHATIDAVMDRLIGLVQTEFVACGTDDAGQVIMASPADCAMQKSRLRAIDYFGEWTEFALVLGSIAIPAGYFTSKFMKMKNISKMAKLDDVADGITYDKKLRAAYQQYAPKNQSFDDFKKMFANEAEFDKQVEAWSSFEPGMVDMSSNPKFSNEKYMPSPYSTYDPELAKQLKAVEAEYADDIAKIQAEVEESKRQFRVFEYAKKADLHEEERAAKEFGVTIKKADNEYTQAITKLEDELKGATGGTRTAKETELKELQSARDTFRKEQEAYLREIDVEIKPDWSKDNPLQPLLDDYADRRRTPRESDYTPEQWSYYVNQKEKENLKQGYEVARDYEKSKLINATISDDVADAVAETRRQELINIIADDDELFAQAQRFSDLSTTEKQTFLQKTHDKLDDATHVKGNFKVRVYEDPKSHIVANAARQYNNKPLGKDLDIDDVLETIAHEQSHLIDSDAPDLGMLGAQKAKERITLPDQGTQWEIRYDWTTGATTKERVKSIEVYEAYRANPTEVSSWRVGGSGKENMMQQIIERRAEMQ